MQVKIVANSSSGLTKSSSHPKSPQFLSGVILDFNSCCPLSKDSSFAFSKLNAFVTSAKLIPLGFSIDFLEPPSNAVPEIFFHELRMFTNHCLEIL